MIKLIIDDIPVEVEPKTTIFDAAKHAGISIPHLCYHPAFIPEGTCRMCLVEIEGAPKLELACSTQVREGMKVYTRNEKVDTARKGVLEFLLADHPLDCPICDQAGECKLQDYYEEYGLFENQNNEVKDRHKKGIRIGKNLIHDQERCVLCRRCVRFLSEITKTQEMGVFERGAQTEVNILDEALVDNNYSGNLAELCPVGALTDLDFRFKTRSWFLESGTSICSHCARGCHITIEYHPGSSRFNVPRRVYRIKAADYNEINQYWICDLGRYAYPEINNDRAASIKVNLPSDSVSPDNPLALVSEKIKHLYRQGLSSRITVILNTYLTNEELFLCKKTFIDDLKLENVYFADPPAGEGDNILLTGDRSPNVRGAQEIGIEIKPFTWNHLDSHCEVLLVFGTFLLENGALEEISAGLKNIPTKILFAPHTSSLDEHFDLIFPTALIPEKSGTLTNIDGVVQSFSPVWETEEEIRAEWESLLAIAKDLNISLNYYLQFSTPADVLQEMKKEIPFFEK